MQEQAGGFVSGSGPAMEFSDRILKCTDCGAEFVFSAGEQAFFREKQFTNDPKRCRQCRVNHGAQRPRFRTETHVVCSDCGAETTVPFKPTQGKPVLCRTCFQKAHGIIERPDNADSVQPGPTEPGSLKSVVPSAKTRKHSDRL